MSKNKSDDESSMEFESETVFSESHAMGVYRLTGPISEKSCARASQFILTESVKGEHSSLCLIIDSGGGDVNAAYSLIAFIKAALIPVNCVAVGTCSSAALFIAMSCENRIIDENCSVLSHQYSADFGGGASKHIDLMARLHDFEMTASRIEQTYVKETKKDIKYVRKHMVKDCDVFMDANECIKHGMFDGLLADNLDILYNGILSGLLAAQESENKDIPLNEVDKLVE
jgi:ATP-dependent protease ClpP protease subunit